MADLHDQESEFVRLLQGLPFDDAPRPDAANDLRQRALAKFDEARQVEPVIIWWKRAIIQGRETMRRPIPRLIAATAACAAIAFWILVPGRESTALAYPQLAKTIIEAKTAQFQMEVSIEGQPKQSFKAWYMAPNKFRQEVGVLTNIADFSSGKMLTLIPDQKKVMILNVKNAPKDKVADNYFAKIQKLLADRQGAKDEKYEKLGEKEIDGKRAVGFRHDDPSGTMTLWGDPRTGQPVRIETVFSGIPHTEVVMTSFQVNVDLNASLFDMSVPEGFKVHSLDVDASQPREQDLVDAFRACAEIGGGEYPESMDTLGVQKVIMKFALSQAKNLKDEKMQSLMKVSIKIGRGFQFALTLPPSAEAAYAGKGVNKDDKERPIFWYKPEGSSKYRVVHADLTITDAETAPRIDGAQRLEKASKAKAAN